MKLHRMGQMQKISQNDPFGCASTGHFDLSVLISKLPVPKPRLGNGNNAKIFFRHKLKVLIDTD